MGADFFSTLGAGAASASARGAFGRMVNEAAASSGSAGVGTTSNKVGEFRYTNTAANHFSDLVKRGPNAGKLSRPYMESPLTINEIMATGKSIPDPGKIPGGLRWDVPGSFRGSEGMWELVLNPESKIIYHFNFVSR